MAFLTTPPTEDTRWASDDLTDPVSGQANVAVPSSARRDLGIGYKNYVPRQFFNFLFRALHKWVTWLKTAADELDGRVEDTETDITTLQGDVSSLDGRVDTIEGNYLPVTAPQNINVDVYLASGGTLSTFKDTITVRAYKIGNMVTLHFPASSNLNASGSPFTGIIAFDLTNLIAAGMVCNHNAFHSGPIRVYKMLGDSGTLQYIGILRLNHLTSGGKTIWTMGYAWSNQAASPVTCEDNYAIDTDAFIITFIAD